MEEGPDRKFSLSRRMMLGRAGRLDSMTCRPDGWQGTEFSDLQVVQNLLEALINSGIHVKKHIYK
jgi:hypothetical protein